MNPFQKHKPSRSFVMMKIQVGDRASLTKTITDEDVINFAKLTGDVNPIHILDSFAKTTMFKERIAHGMLVSSFISTILGTKLLAKIRFIYLKTFHSALLSKSAIHFALWQRSSKNVTIKNHYVTNKYI
ncbi:MaoC family dehydratase [Bacillus pacificus]